MQENESAGLPMTARWDPEKLVREKAELKELEGKPLFQRARGYIKRTGPGLLQSAMTLGAGSATASVVAGASFGYKLLWVQPVAMFLGVMMLAALGNVVLTTGERPYKAFGERLSTKLVFLWALGTILSSIIWHFPQYGLAAGAARDLASMAGAPPYQAGPEGAQLFTTAGLLTSFGVGFLILGINIFTVWSYGSSTRGIKLYEWFLRSVIALIIVMFAIVVASNIHKVKWGELIKGFTGWYGIPGHDNVKHVTLVLGMLGAAVGINMTFLYPYTLLAKGWGREHKKLSRWDLGMSMFLPFALVTSLVIVAMTVTGVYQETGTDMLQEKIKPVDAAISLTGLLGKNAGRIIFDLGLIAMTCSAISTHMVVCGFTLCEMFGLEYTKARFRIFALAPSIGLLGVVTKLPFWFPVAASAVCFAMLPVAYLTFLIMNNMRSYIGDAVGRGWRRALFNAILVLALSLAAIGSLIQIKNRVVDRLWPAQTYKLSIPIRAPRGEVWKALTEEADAWWPAGRRVLAGGSTVTLEAVAAGRLIETGAGGGSVLWHTVRMVRPGEALHLVGHVASEKGGQGTTMIELALKEEGGSTVLHIKGALYGQVSGDDVAGERDLYEELFARGLKEYVEAP